MKPNKKQIILLISIIALIVVSSIVYTTKLSITNTLLSKTNTLEITCKSNGNATVSCSDGSMWQDNDDEVGVEKINWDEARKYCKNLKLAGYDDWRLPNIYELESIVDYTKNKPALKDGFTKRSSVWFWSSTTDASGTSNAWGVGFVSGYSNRNYKSNNYFVRCTR